TATDNLRLTTNALGWRVASVFLRGFVHLYQHCIVNVASKGIFNRIQVDFVAIGRELYSISQALCYVIDKMLCGPCIAISKRPREDELAVRVDCAPQPNISRTWIFGCDFRCNVLIFAIPKS